MASALVWISTVTVVRLLCLHWGNWGKSQLEGIPAIYSGEEKATSVEVKCEQLETKNNLCSTDSEIF